MYVPLTIFGKFPDHSVSAYILLEVYSFTAFCLRLAFIGMLG